MTDEELFERARQIPGDQQTEFLRENGSGDQQFERVMQLLDADEVADSLLDLPSTSDVQPASALPAKEQIGNYKLIHKIGEGGMGSVYMAEQTQPVKRRVAVKIIKQGMNSEQFVARFEAERQALAMMDHPNIAKVLDAGCTGEGLPFFVMELVKGIPITEFCDQNKIGTLERLELFIQVCNAVQHAHQKGIIHRDLKPSNVMVAMYDDCAVPKVIDFGVAKATHQPLTEQTLYTVPGQIVGTWEYMSPEQAILNQLDVDTRTDVYSLGVILYELLTGHTPLDLKSLGSGALEERLRRIREQEPSRPSLRVSSMGAEAGSLATYRGTEARSLTQTLRGDLDWIVMKALEKDRSRRYETANGFAAEIKRYLNDEPISFRPPSSWQQLGRFYRRNRVIANAVTCSIAALGIGLTFAIFSMNDAIEKKKEADQYAEELIKERNEKDQALAQKDSLLQELSIEFVEKALIHSMNNDVEKMDAALESAIEYGADPICRDLLYGQLHVYGINPGEAIPYLERAVRQKPNSAAANGLLTTAYMFHGYFSQFVAQVQKTGTLQPKDEFDYLFAGGGLTMNEDENALAYVDQAMQQRMMPLGLAIQAQTLGHKALDLGEKAMAHRGIRKIQAAKELMPENKFVRMIEVSLHHTAFNLGVEGVDKQRMEQVIRDAGDMGRYSIGHYVNGMTYVELGMWKEAERALELTLRDTNWWWLPAWYSCGEGDFEKARYFVSMAKSEHLLAIESRDLMIKNIELLEGRREPDFESAIATARRYHQRILDAEQLSPEDNADSEAFEHLLLLGLYAEAKEIYSDESITFNFDRSAATFVIHRPIQSPEVQVLLSTSNAAKAQIYYSYALVEIAKGNRPEAISLLQQALDSKFFFYNYYEKSRALHKLLTAGHPFPSMPNTGGGADD